jgi:hypothetical protein
MADALVGHSGRAQAVALALCHPEAEVVAEDAIRRTSTHPSLLSTDSLKC